MSDNFDDGYYNKNSNLFSNESINNGSSNNEPLTNEANDYKSPENIIEKNNVSGGIGVENFNETEPQPFNAEESTIPSFNINEIKNEKKPLSNWAVGAICSVGTAVVVCLLVFVLATAGVFNNYSSTTPLNSNPASDSTIIAQAGSTLESPNWEAVSKATGSSVVSIQVESETMSASGSGAIIDESGYVITNNHVIEGATTIQVTLQNGDIYKAKLKGTDPTTDLAIIQIQNPPAGLKALAFEDSSTLLIGQPVMAIGNPLGYANSVSTGIVSALNRPVAATSGESDGTGANEAPIVTNAIQIDAAINPGNSGGPLFDGNGKVVGITSAYATTSQSSGNVGIGFAIPAKLASLVAAQLIAKGEVIHAMAGVGIKDGTATINGVGKKGATIGSIESSSSAGAAGIKKGDLVIGIDGNIVIGVYSFQGYVHEYSPGDEVTLTVIRDGKQLDIKVTLVKAPDVDNTATQEYQPQQRDNSSTQQSPSDPNMDDLFRFFGF
jgi:putative serine protease PepD